MSSRTYDFYAIVTAQNILRSAYDQLRYAYASGCDWDPRPLNTIQHAIDYIWRIYYEEYKPIK